MVPGGDDERARLLAQAVITNAGSGSRKSGNYTYGLTRQTNTGRDPGLWKTGHVEDFPRERLNVWHLLARVLEDATS